MRLWYLPPKYLDNSTLTQEYENIENLLSNDSISNSEWGGYYFLRLTMLFKEIQQRKLIYLSNLDVIELNPNDFQLKNFPNETDIGNSIRVLIDSWKDQLNNNGIFEKFNLLTSENPEDVWLESEWMLELYRKEYDL